MGIPLLTLQNVALTFGGTPLLEDASLSVTEGDRICIVGRNGSGKSTLHEDRGGLVRAGSRHALHASRQCVALCAAGARFRHAQDRRSGVESGLAPGDDPHRARMIWRISALRARKRPRRRRCSAPPALAQDAGAEPGRFAPGRADQPSGDSSHRMAGEAGSAACARPWFSSAMTAGSLGTFRGARCGWIAAGTRRHRYRLRAASRHGATRRWRRRSWSGTSLQRKIGARGGIGCAMASPRGGSEMCAGWANCTPCAMQREPEARPGAGEAGGGGGGGCRASS